MIGNHPFFYIFMKKEKLIIPALSIIVVAGILLSACSDGQNTAGSGNATKSKGQGSQMSMDPVTPPELTTEQLAQLQEGLKTHTPTTLTFNVGGGNFYFVPNVIRVKQGDTVKIIFTNNGGYHNFILDEFGIKFDPIKTGETKTVQFVADKKGRFEYYCSVANHRLRGQKGQLVVE